MKRYECNGTTYEANSIYEAYLKAIMEFGVEAIGKCVKGVDTKEMFCGVCIEAYRGHFPTFTDEDFLAYEIACNTAWAFGNKTKRTEYDGFEEYEVVSLDSTALSIIKNTKLDKYMDEIGFEW